MSSEDFTSWSSSSQDWSNSADQWNANAFIQAQSQAQPSVWDAPDLEQASSKIADFGWFASPVPTPLPRDPWSSDDRSSRDSWYQPPSEGDQGSSALTSSENDNGTSLGSGPVILGTVLGFDSMIPEEFKCPQLKSTGYYQPRSPIGESPEGIPCHQLPFVFQDALLVSVQDILERSFFSFIQAQQPTLLRDKGIESHRQLELNVWPRFLDTIEISSPSVLRDVVSTSSDLSDLVSGQPHGSSGGATLRDALWRISQLRHATVHRCPVSVLLVRDMLVDACRICWGLRDTEKFNKLREAYLEIENVIWMPSWEQGRGHFRIPALWLYRLQEVITKLKGSSSWLDGGDQSRSGLDLSNFGSSTDSSVPDSGW